MAAKANTATCILLELTLLSNGSGGVSRKAGSLVKKKINKKSLTPSEIFTLGPRASIKIC